MIRNEEEDAIRNADEESPQLPEALLREHLAAFMDPEDAILVKRSFCESARECYRGLLSRFQEDHHVDTDWRDRLQMYVLGRWMQLYAERSYVGGDALPREPTLNDRLLWKFRDHLYLAKTEIDFRGPSVVLPNERLAFLCRDNIIRIFDMRQKKVIVEAAIVFRPSHEARISTVRDDLSYADGRLVLHRRDWARQFISSIHVWKIEGQNDIPFSIPHVRSIDLNECSLRFVVVAADGKMYYLRDELREEECNLYSWYHIESHDVATGVELARSERTTMPPVKFYDPMDPPVYLSIMGDYIVLVHKRWSIQAFRRSDLSQTCTYNFAAFADVGDDCCFVRESFCTEAVGGDCCFVRESFCTESKHSIFFYVPSGTHYRKLSINNDGIFTLDPVEFVLGRWHRGYLMLVTDSRVYVENNDRLGNEGLKLDEYDIATGEKTRSLSMNAARSGCSIVNIHTNEREIIVISQADTHPGGGFIQTFLRE